MKGNFKYTGPDGRHGLESGKVYRCKITNVDDHRRITGLKVKLGQGKYTYIRGSELFFFKAVLKCN